MQIFVSLPFSLGGDLVRVSDFIPAFFGSFKAVQMFFQNVFG